MKKIILIIAFFAIINGIVYADPYSIFFNGRDFRSPPQLDSYNYDAQSYNIKIDIYFQEQLIFGENDIAIVTQESPFDSLYLDFAEEMTVDSIVGPNLSFTHENGKLKLYFDSSYTEDETLNFNIYYHGDPSSVSDSGLSFAFHSGSEIVSTLSEPTGAKSWFPLKDVPYDKVISHVTVTAPDTLFAVSNGVLDSVKYHSGRATYYWNEQYPIAPYLISIAVTNYSNFAEMYYFNDGDSIPLIYYVYPEDYNKARIDFSNIPRMLDFYNSYFGKYPFAEEKYGMAEFTWRPSMEHQTITSISYRMITGNHDYDYVFAHELAHQWWGDLVTCGTWKDIWLNEGFATYSDAMYHQYEYGDSAFQKRMSDFKHYYFIDDSTVRYTVYNPLYMWRATVYEKGAWVLNMLRGVVGNSVFKEILANYREQYAFSSAVSQDFIDVCESTCGSDLSWFFTEWLYKAGYPEYEIAFKSVGDSSGKFKTEISVIQNQDTSINTPYVFEMPITFRLYSNNNDTTVQFFDSLRADTFSVYTSDSIISVVFDPDSLILKTVNYKPWGVSNPIIVNRIAEIRMHYRSGNIYFEGIGQDKYTYSIFDLSGREITKGILVKGKIGQLKLVQGFYFLKLNNNQMNNYFKFVVLR